MPLNAFSRDPLRVLSADAVEGIHRAALSLLERVGVRLDCDEALRLLADYGVRCDPAMRRAYPDEEAVRRALATVRKGYSIFGRGGRQGERLDIGPDTVHTISGGAALKLYRGGAYTDATRADLVDMIALHDKLPHVHVLINPVEPPAMKGPNIYPEIAALHFIHTGKPLLLQASGRRDLEKIVRMAALIAGGRDALRERPVFMTGSNAEPPLAIPREAAEVVVLAAREGVPCSLGDYVMAGATGPLDVAASLAQRTATVLCGLVLSQAAQPGSAYDFSCHNGACDLATGDVVTMSPRVMQLVAGSVQMGRHYGLVTNALAATDAPAPDAQAAGERFFSLTVAVLAGASLIQGATAEMAGMELADFAQCVIDNEIAGYVLDFASGVSSDELAEGVAAVEEVVRDAEYSSLRFLGHPHTAQRCRRPAYRHGLFSAGMLSRWLAGRREPLYAQAERIARELVAEKTEYVPPDLKAELLAIAREGGRP